MKVSLRKFLIVISIFLSTNNLLGFHLFSLENQTYFTIDSTRSDLFQIEISNSQIIFSQTLSETSITDTVSSESTTSQRKYFITTNVGYPNYFGLGFGYQIDNSWSLTLKGSMYYDGIKDVHYIYIGTPVVTLKLSKYVKKIPFIGFNNLGFELGFFHIKDFYSGLVELSFGHEYIESNKLGIHLAVTFSHITSTIIKPFIIPGIRLGLNLNF